MNYPVDWQKTAPTGGTLDKCRIRGRRKKFFSSADLCWAFGVAKLMVCSDQRDWFDRQNTETLNDGSDEHHRASEERVSEHEV